VYVIDILNRTDKLTLDSMKFEHAKYSFKSARKLFKKIETEMEGFGGPKWHVEDIILPDAPKDKVTLFYRDLQECSDFQFGRPWFAGKMDFGPQVVYRVDDDARLYENPCTGDHWNERQASGKLNGYVSVIDMIKYRNTCLRARHLVEYCLPAMQLS
jgi:hypothetical protein